MKKIRNAKILTFDIETTGLSGIDNDFFIAVAYEGNKSFIINSLEEFNSWRDNYKWNEWIILTYNGQNYRGGFDLPFLRSQFIKHNLDWPFKNFWHIDYLPIIKKYFDTSKNEIKIDSVSKLYKNDLVKLCKVNGIKYQSTKQDTYDMLKGLDEVDWLDHKKELNKDHNDMQSVYQFYFDQNCEEEYIDGADVPKLIEEGKTDEVIKHCINDVKRLYKLTVKTMNYLPDEIFQKHLEQL